MNYGPICDKYLHIVDLVVRFGFFNNGLNDDEICNSIIDTIQSTLVLEVRIWFSTMYDCSYINKTALINIKYTMPDINPI